MARSEARGPAGDAAGAAGDVLKLRGNGLVWAEPAKAHLAEA